MNRLLWWCVPISAVMAAAGGGCVSTPAPAETGIRIGDETLKQFKVGVTTEAWLLAILGPPTSQAVVEGVDNTRVLRYATGESTRGLGSLFSNASRNTSVVYFIITDGVMTRFWADRAIERTILGKPVEQPDGEKKE